MAVCVGEVLPLMWLEASLELVLESPQMRGETEPGCDRTSFMYTRTTYFQKLAKNNLRISVRTAESISSSNAGNISVPIEHRLIALPFLVAGRTSSCPSHDPAASIGSAIGIIHSAISMFAMAGRIVYIFTVFILQLLQLPPYSVTTRHSTSSTSGDDSPRMDHCELHS